MRYFSDILKIRDSIIYNSNVKSEIKVAGLGDIHLSKLVDNNDIDSILRTLYVEKPNYICILGDIIDSPFELSDKEKLNELKKLIQCSAAMAPTLIILGSHDFIDETTDEYEDVLNLIDVWHEIKEMKNVHLLNDEIFSNNEIFIAGYRQKREVYYNLLKEKKEDSKAYYDDLIKYSNLYQNLPSNLPKIYLTHSPEPIQDNVNMDLLKDYDVIMTGHYHNGCVPAFLDDIWMPKNGGIITPKKNLLPNFARGVVKLETGSLLVYNGGWTKIQACAPKVLQPLDKLCNRQMDIITLTSNPEINEIEVKNRKKLLKSR